MQHPIFSYFLSVAVNLLCFYLTIPAGEVVVLQLGLIKLFVSISLMNLMFTILIDFMLFSAIPMFNEFMIWRSTRKNKVVRKRN